MPVTYTNRKGKTYTLCQRLTKTGKVRYIFMADPAGDRVEQLPEGFEIRENVNGQVSLARKTPSMILEEELIQVRRSIEKALNPTDYRVDVKEKEIILYEIVGPSADEIVNLFNSFVPHKIETREKARHFLSRTAQFSPMTRFVLVNTAQRKFEAKRLIYSGEDNRWHHIGSGKLVDLLAKIIPALDTDEYFELD